MSEKLLESTLKYDPIQDAEEQYGKIGENNQALSYAMEQMRYKQQQLKDIFITRQDTYSDMPADEYLKVVKRNNFQALIQETFYDRDGRPNDFFVFWHPKGLLLVLDTFTWFGIQGKTINSAYLYYNIEMKVPFEKYAGKVASGCLHWNGPFTPDDRNLTNIWVGYKDAREGLMYHMYGLNSVGDFLTEWVDSSQVIISHYMDSFRHTKENLMTRCKMMKEITIQRFDLMGLVGQMLLRVHKNV